MLLQLVSPLDVLDLANGVTVGLQSAKEVIEAKTRVASNVEYAELLRSERLSRQRREHGNVIDRAHIECVVDVWDKAELETTLDHTPDEVVGVGNGGLGVTKDIRRAENVTGKTTLGRLQDYLLGNPLALTVTSVEASSSVLEVILLRKASLAHRQQLVGLADKRLIVKNSGGRDEAEELGFRVGNKVQRSHSRKNIGGAHLGVGVDPVDDGTVMEDGVRLRGNASPGGCVKTKLLITQVSHDGLDAPVLDPLLVPGTTPLSTVAKSGKACLGSLGANETDDLGGAAREEVAEDECAEEAGGASEEDGELLGGEVGRERLEGRGKVLGQKLDVGSVRDLLDLLLGGLGGVS
ncbi:uncharacterized protein LOC62_01G000873 [Vanrija pseudolonga]|uniref:Uncharacterized protein n=1 Tax=Vanrija pseudolonga TaxID=143232 RepID=A0AAF0Y424_9TREE|nr:hypothetical protein LOC62_01G000873 [Vanrija pseudolonga]